MAYFLYNLIFQDVKSCVKSQSWTGTVRIFLAPKYDEKKNKLWLSQQRRLFVALDAFTVPRKNN